MKTNELFEQTMRALWDNIYDTTPKEAVAVASYIKTHRVNAENALEVLRIMWPDAKVVVRHDAMDQADNEAWFDIQFEDGSQILVGAPNGIGSSLEMI